MAFARLTPSQSHVSESPVELYSTLRRTASGSQSLWAHQAEALAGYLAKKDASDVAIELPTGTGKTLVGLLIAHWRMQPAAPSLYAVPTRQLADQVVASAEAEGIPAVALTGRHSDWDVSSRAKVQSSEAVGVTTYSSIFNSNPKVPEPGTIVFDDAHAAEQFIGDAYSLTVSRSSAEGAYKAILKSIAPFLNDSTVRQLEQSRLDGVRTPVRLLLPAGQEQTLRSLHEVLTGLGDNYKYKVALLQDILDSCAVYVTYDQIVIRPFVPPTHLNSIFQKANQRVYLSATLGAGGELERSFGRVAIERVNPTTAIRQGRRFYIFPDLVEDTDSIALTRQLLKEHPKALVLKQASSSEAEMLAAVLGEGAIDLYRKDILTDPASLESFKSARTGLLALANRFDGLDFPGETCRMTVLEGDLRALNLQERFLASRVGSRHVLSERISTRISQASGRCTRHQNDPSVVVILGNDATLRFSDPTFLSAQTPENQAEILMGWGTSKISSAPEMVQNMKIFLEQSDEWNEAEEEIIRASRDKKQVYSPDLQELAASAPAEVSAWQLAHDKEWAQAGRALRTAASQLTSSSLRGYRGFLLYQSAIWLEVSDEDRSSEQIVQELKRQAKDAAQATRTWISETESYRSKGSYEYSPADVIAIREVASFVQRGKAQKCADAAVRAVRLLEESESSKFEKGLVQLGTHLGANSFKPDEESHCDAAWLWGNELWITHEAKSEQSSGKGVSVKDIRQANTQLDALAELRKVDHPTGSFSTLITDRTIDGLKPRSHARSHLYLLSTDEIQAVAVDVADAWGDIFAWGTGKSDADYFSRVGEVLSGRGCLPSQLISRLQREQINP